MPAVRPYWKGYIKLALVSCPIGLWAASSSSERVAFRQINKKTGNRLRQQLIDEETRIAVEAHDKGRGYEHAKGSYLMIEDHELEAIEIESNHTIEIDSFVPRAEIDERFLDSPYYVAPNEPVGQEAFAVIREAMRGKDMVALGRVVLSKRERVIMLQPWTISPIVGFGDDSVATKPALRLLHKPVAIQTSLATELRTLSASRSRFRRSPQKRTGRRVAPRTDPSLRNSVAKA
jgi:non-homologous end joining protein Ku